MNLLRKALVPLAVVTVLVLVMSVAVPRAVHAVVATLVRDVDNPGRHPFSANCTAGFGFLSDSAMCTITAPVGEEVIIQNESFQVVAIGGITNAAIQMTTTTGGGTANFYSFATPPSTPAPSYPNGSPLSGPLAIDQHDWVISVDPGTAISCYANTTALKEGGSMNCQVVGYYVTLP